MPYNNPLKWTCLLGKVFGDDLMPLSGLSGINRFLAALLLAATSFVAWLESAADEAAKIGKAGNNGPTRSGRTSWTTSRVVGSPDPPAPFKVVRVFPNLKFQNPLLIARIPGSNRFVVGEQAGILYSFNGDR